MDLPHHYFAASDLQNPEKFARHLLLSEFGLQGQLNIQNSKVLIIGMGGLGSPVSLYLAAAGIGTLGLVDHDTVDNSNLHRQIVHSTTSLNQLKVESARKRLLELNPWVKISCHSELFTSDVAMEIISKYDVVADCTDNVATRYLINDACVLLDKPLVSAASVRWDGQLTVYNYKKDIKGPCLRCIFPAPPPVASVVNCNEAGVMGVVPGILGTLQALECIKICSKQPKLEESVLSGRLLLYSGLSLDPIKTVKLRPRRKDCVICGDNPTQTTLIDYPAFCGSGPDDGPRNITELDETERITPQQLLDLLKSDKDYMLVDTRDEQQYSTAHFTKSINIPFEQFSPQHEQLVQAKHQSLPIYIVCRRGNDSQLAVKQLKQQGYSQVWDVKGGVTEWAKTIDPAWPIL